MDRSEQIADLALALVKAQGEIEGAIKSGVNPHLKSKYADLASVWEACRPALTKHGLSVTQMPHSLIDEQGRTHLFVRTILLHQSGQFIGDTCEIPLQKQDAQGVGSAITYGRRYGLAAIVGVCPADDDGEAAVGRGKGKRAESDYEQARGEPSAPLPDVTAPYAPVTPAAPAAPNSIEAGPSQSVVGIAPQTITPAQAALQPIERIETMLNKCADALAAHFNMDVKQARKTCKQYLKLKFPDEVFKGTNIERGKVACEYLWEQFREDAYIAALKEQN